MHPGMIDIKAESFPWQMKLLGALFIVGGIASLVTIWWLSFILILAGLLFITAHSGTEIDPDAKTYREYTSYLFFRNGQTKIFQGVEKIFINASKESRIFYTAHTLHSSTFQDTAYDAYMKFWDGEKIYLTSRKAKDKLIDILIPVGERLRAPLIDQTAGSAFAVSAP